MREKLIKILRVPIFPHELIDPTEAVADYLLDNDVVPVVRCKDCKIAVAYPFMADSQKLVCTKSINWRAVEPDHFCSYGERKTMIIIKLNDHTAEDLECIRKLQSMGFSDEYIQELYNRSLEREKDNDRERKG